MVDVDDAISASASRRPRIAVLATTALVVVVLAALLVHLNHRPDPTDQGTERVRVADLIPMYKGRPTTWDAVTRNKQIFWVYADAAGNHVKVFDTERELVAWQCSADSSGVDCPRSSQNN